MLSESRSRILGADTNSTSDSEVRIVGEGAYSDTSLIIRSITPSKLFQTSSFQNLITL